MMIPSMSRTRHRKSTCGIKSRNLPTLLFLLIAFIAGSMFNDFIRTNMGITIPTPTDCNEHIHEDPLQSDPERERIRELYTAAKVLDSEYTFQWTRGLTNELSILNTRQFYTEPRPETCDYCNRMEAVAVLEPQDLCAGDTGIDLLVLITTIPQEVEGRMAVRDTWGSLTRANTASVRYVFLFGTGYDGQDQDIVNEEYEIYDDVLQHDHKDSYFNLTYKVVSGFTWATKHCPRAQFILRTATDNFINIPALTTYLNTHQDKMQRTQMGRVHPVMARFQFRDSKFYVPNIEYPHNTYPPFAIGSAFVFSMKTVKEILKAAPHIPVFALEDCWFGLLMEQIGILPVNYDGFDVTPDMEELELIPSGACPRNGSFFAVHIPIPFLIGSQTAEQYQFLYWLWASCEKYGLSKRIN